MYFEVHATSMPTCIGWDGQEEGSSEDLALVAFRAAHEANRHIGVFIRWHEKFSELIAPSKVDGCGACAEHVWNMCGTCVEHVLCSV